MWKQRKRRRSRPFRAHLLQRRIFIVLLAGIAVSLVASLLKLRWNPWWGFGWTCAIAALQGWSSRLSNDERRRIVHAIESRLKEGHLTNSEAELSVRFYEEIRERVTAVACGESTELDAEAALRIVLRGGQDEDLKAALENPEKWRSAPRDLTLEDENRLLEAAGESLSVRTGVLKWLCEAGREQAICDLIRGPMTQDCPGDAARELLRRLPELRTPYGDAVLLLSGDRLKRELRHQTDVLADLEKKMIDLYGNEFEQTAEVIGAIDDQQGRDSLDRVAASLAPTDERRSWVAEVRGQLIQLPAVMQATKEVGYESELEAADAVVDGR